MLASARAAAVHQSRLFFTALEYFTRWPKPRWVGHDPAWLGHCARYLPAVGMFVGLWGAGVYVVAALWWPAPVAVVLSTAATLLLTGAFHEDGFADVCDGLGSTHDRERTLAIMSDSRVGAFGAIGIGVMLLLKFACLATMRTGPATVAIVCAHIVSRAAPLALMLTLPYAKPQGESKAKPVVRGVGATEIMVGVLSSALAVGAASWLIAAEPQTHAARWFIAVALSFAAALACAAPLRAWFGARLGGYTGDCLGATQQISEVVFYLCFSAALGMH
jgi:adenosylcobinamide-GDP ribazoletransferase